MFGHTYIACTDLEFLEVAKTDGFDIELTCQPPNSLDLIVLDLGYFRAIQALQQEMKWKSIDVLVDVVTQSYYAFKPNLSNFVWLSLQYYMVGEVINIFVCNAYKIPHVGKNALLRNGELPISVSIDPETVRQSSSSLKPTTF
ncbi:unnamed protein product [Cuscuta campestris]|uniref:Uncharacterized protein n=1 Tax=Cuscuta campestris TaxID=132261 RepID=A0A484L5T2_9ASTE|nr:unnamed protein product [Cuscuta campestris]